MLAALFFFADAAFSMPIRGIVKAGKENLADVIVTDGFSFVRTDGNG